MSEQKPTANPRYPRPEWLRLFRSLTPLWWIVPIAIIIFYILSNFVIFLFHGSIKNLSVSITFLLLLALSILAGIFTRHWSEEDERQEDNYQYQQHEKQREEARRQSREREKQSPPIGFKLRHKLLGHAASIFSVGWSSDGKTLTSVSYDKTIKLWNVQIGQVLHILSGHTNLVYSAAWSPDGKQLASGSDDRTIKLWDSQTGQVLHTLSYQVAF